MMVQCLRDAKACKNAAARAEAEASEYRRKAEELLKNAMAEAAMFGGEVEDNDAGNFCIDE